MQIEVETSSECDLKMIFSLINKHYFKVIVFEHALVIFYIVCVRNFTVIDTSPLPVNGCKIKAFLSVYGL